MPVVTVPMYRIVCDQEDCNDSPQDHDEFFAWAEWDQALIPAEDMDWYVSRARDPETGYPVAIFCGQHAPQCQNEECGVFLRDEEFGPYCEEHTPEEVSS